MMKKNIFLPFFLFVFSLSVFCRDITIELRTEQTQLNLEDQTLIQVAIKNSSSIDSNPEILGLSNFDVESAGESSNITIINGSMTSEKVFNFYVTPKQAGQFVVGPAKVKINGKDFSSNTLNIMVGKGSGANTAAPTGSTQSEEETRVDNKDHGNYFVTAEVSDKNPYVNQQVIYTFRFHNRTEVANANLQLPNFQGFWKEKMGDQREYFTHVNGLEYHVTEIRFALFPLNVGNLNIDPTSLQIQVMEDDTDRGGRRGRRSANPFFDDFFGGGIGQRRLRKKNLSTTPLPLTVRALPVSQSEGKKTNLVGDFQAALVVSKKKLKVGESSTVTITLKGDGNVRDIAELPVENNDFKIYPDQPQMQFNTKGPKLISEKVFKYAIVPKKSGTLNLPPLHLEYFDPYQHQYKPLLLGDISFEVEENPEMKNQQIISPPNSSSFKKDVLVQNTDLMPIIRTESDLFSIHLTSWPENLLKFFSALMIALYLLFSWISSGKRKNDLNPRFRIGQKAYKNFSTHFKQVKSVEDVHHLIKTYLIEKFHLEITALTSQDVGNLSLPFNDSVKNQLQSLLEKAEFYQYSGNSNIFDKDAYMREVGDLVKTIDKEAR